MVSWELIYISLIYTYIHVYIYIYIPTNWERRLRRISSLSTVQIYSSLPHPRQRAKMEQSVADLAYIKPAATEVENFQLRNEIGRVTQDWPNFLFCSKVPHPSIGGEI